MYSPKLVRRIFFPPPPTKLVTAFTNIEQGLKKSEAISNKIILKKEPAYKRKYPVGIYYGIHKIGFMDGVTKAIIPNQFSYLSPKIKQLVPKIIWKS